jgi:Flp pilus assembly protein TadD
MREFSLSDVLGMVVKALVVWACGQGAAIAQSYLEQARTYIDAKQYERAIQVLQASRTEAQSRNAEARVDNLIGWSYFSLGKVSDAEQFLILALASAERENDMEVSQLAANNLGVVYFVEGDLDKSLSYFNAPYTRETKLARQYRDLISKKHVEIEAERNVQEGISARLTGKFDQAVQSYDKALRLTPEDPMVLELKGYALFRMGNYDEAITTLEAALVSDTARTRAFIPLNMIKAYCAAGRDQQISPLLRTSNIAAATLLSWWDKDAELRKVCARSAALRNALARRP